MSGDDESPEPLDEIFFSLMCTLCDRFPALSPFSIRRERFRDVLAVFADAKRETESRNARQANGGTRPPDGSYIRGGVLYKPAQNDDWY